MTKSHVRRTETGYKANADGATQPGMGTPNGHSGGSMVDPAGGGEEGKPYLRRSRLWSVHTGLPGEQSTGTGVEKSAKVVVALPGEGPHQFIQGAVPTSR
jgi:hypothetical protein